MIKVLLKKQLAEIFKAYFFDIKKNKARSKASIIMYFALFVFLMVGIMGFMFGALSFALSPILTMGFGWLYYAIFSLLAVLLGVFGSVFSTYSGLYLAKDNDLLLSMPIPVRAIMISRLLGVYLMGLMYSAVVIIPAIIVHFITVPIKLQDISGAVLLPVVISLFVLALSCIFGYFVARISLKLKNKSFITVLISILFFALYYFVYFKASSFIGEFVKNIAIYGENIKKSAYAVYIIGGLGEGKLISVAIVSAAVLAVLFITLCIISKSFLKIATGTAVLKRVKYKEKSVKARSASAAVLLKELRRFTSSPNYMLNCGLGVLFMLAAGVFILIKGSAVREALNGRFAEFSGLAYVAACALICLMVSMNDTAAPSVSLEGKTLWQIRCLPVPAKAVLKAKFLLQFYLNIIPAGFCAGCVVVALEPDVITGALIVIFCAVYVLFHSMFSLYCGLHKVNLTWINEVVPIKQGINVVFAIFGGWAFAIVIGVAYLLLGVFVDVRIYLSVATLVFSLLSLLIHRWINKKGVKVFEAL